jgi:DNA-binding NarL/FixJ family response regulator
VRVLIADDAAVLRRALASIIEPAGNQLVGEALDTGEALDLAQRLLPEVIAVDSRLPPSGGAHAVAQLRSAVPNAAVLLVAAAVERDAVREALAVGARGVLVRPFAASQVLGVLAGLARTGLR